MACMSDVPLRSRFEARRRGVFRRRWVACVVLVVVWAVLYLPHLRTSPGWYGDETLIHAVSREVVRGVPGHYALWNTFWHPHYPYQPLYSAVCGAFAWVAHGDLVGSRFFNALLALGVAMTLSLGGACVAGRLPAWFSALVFLTYSQSIIHFRMSYVHNAAGLGVLLLVLGLLRPPTRANHVRAGLGLAVAAGAHPLFIYAGLGALIARIRRPGSWPWLFGPAAAVVGLTLGLVYWRFGGWLFEDLAQLRDSFTRRGTNDGSGMRGLFNLGRFAFQDLFHAGAMIGLMAAWRRRWRPLCIIGGLVLFLLVRNRSNLVPFYYQAVIVLPTMCLAWGVLFARSTRLLGGLSSPIRYLLRLLWLIPVTQLVAVLPAVVSGHLLPRNQYWVTQSCAEVDRAAAWINERVISDDFVVANPNIAWLLRCKTAPYLQVITWYGLPTQGYERGNARERFRYEASLEAARFAVVGDIDPRWTFGEPNVAILPERMQREQWPVVWRGEFYLVLENPTSRAAPGAVAPPIPANP